MNEIPHRPIIDLEAALSQFGHQAAQGEGAVPDAPRQKGRVLASDRLGLASAHPARRDAARLAKAPDPIDHRARRDPEARRRIHAATAPPSKPRPPRAGEDPLNKAFPSMLASCPASTVNQNDADSGIPLDSAQSHPALEAIRGSLPPSALSSPGDGAVVNPIDRVSSKHHRRQAN